jgi:hypothetical protein
MHMYAYGCGCAPQPRAHSHMGTCVCFSLMDFREFKQICKVNCMYMPFTSMYQHAPFTSVYHVPWYMVRMVASVCPSTAVISFSRLSRVTQLGCESVMLENLIDAGSQRHVRAAARHASITVRTHGKGSEALEKASTVLKEALALRYGPVVRARYACISLKRISLC